MSAGNIEYCDNSVSSISCWSIAPIKVS